ncbi:hypothetical protein ABDJ96_003783 [Salmonella enterica]|nr:hypothetical protein [Salmonella enterica subsp. enterica serovar Rubislaw]ELO3942403.1 hypothetical protein [Salmonella enterica]ELU8881657.1 hypothetical protein [Salmonella enterica]
MSEFRRWKGERLDDCNRLVRRALLLLGYWLFGVLVVAEAIFIVWIMSAERG